MKTTRWTTEESLYALAFLLALGLRLFNLGKAPLSDLEANWALQALSLARQQPANLGPQPGYLMATGFMFYILGATNFLARFFPAIVGALLPWTAYFFRSALGRRAALILAFGLALDPGLVAVSRLAGSPMLALGFGLLAVALLYARHPGWAGILAGLACLGGPAVVPGLLGLLLAYGLFGLLRQGKLTADPISGGGIIASIRPMVIYFIGTLLLTGTLFFRFPQGIGAWADSLVAYLDGFAGPVQLPAGRLLVILAVYEPLPLLIGVLGVFKAWLWADRESGKLGRLLSLWAGLALCLALIVPARQASDLAWVLAPLWTLAAMLLEPYFNFMGEDEEDGSSTRLISFGQALLLFILGAYIWLRLAGLAGALEGQALLVQGNLLMIIVATLLVILVASLVGYGWSWMTMRRGLAWAACISLGLYMLSGMWSATQSHAGQGLDWWDPSPATGQADFLLQTLGDLSQWHTGDPTSLDVTVLADMPSLRWALRDWPNVHITSALALGEKPSVVLAYAGQTAPNLQAAYSGESFNWLIYPNWQGVLPPNFLAWLVFHTEPQLPTQLILWAQTGLFPVNQPALPTQP